jgi:hypothetical protein
VFCCGSSLIRFCLPFDLQYAQLFLYECLDVYTLYTSLHVLSRSTDPDDDPISLKHVEKCKECKHIGTRIKTVVCIEGQKVNRI